MTSRKRIFTLKEARQLLPQVQEITSVAVNKLEGRVVREDEYNAVVRDWIENILDLGCEVKGLWLVDFDSGDGLYYCWRYPETAIEYFHDYDGGFASRRPLGPLAVQ